MTDKLAYTTRYVYADTTVSSHGGSAGNVYIKSEEHARLQQMANHLERCCNDLHRRRLRRDCHNAHFQRSRRRTGQAGRTAGGQRRVQRNRRADCYRAAAVVESGKGRQEV